MEKEDKQPFGELLGRFRARSRLSQQALADKLGVTRLTVINWEKGNNLPKVRSMLLDVAEHLVLDEKERDELLAAAFFQAEPKRSLFSVPLHQNPYFLGRDNLLEQIHQQLQRGEATALTQPAALSGLGGIGKTQTAVEYAYRYQHEYTSVLWLQAETQESLYTSCNMLAQVLRLPEQSEQSKVVTAVQHWFREHKGWLMVLDNVENLHLIQAFLPTGYQGSVLLTTRVRRTNPLAQAVEVKQLPETDGVLFLLRRAGRLTLPETIEQATPNDVTSAKALWTRMDGLPLALDQAGAYIHEMDCSVQEYLALFDQCQAELLKERGHWSLDHPASVATTFTLAHQQIHRRNPLAGDLLTLCAFLAPNQIPEEIISRGGTYLGLPTNTTGEVDILEVRKLIGLLSLYSLIERDTNDRTFSVHRLVQAVLRDQMDEQSKQQWTKQTTRAVHAVLPTVEQRNWSRWERVVIHVQVCAQHIEDYRNHSREAASILQQAGWYLTERARYSEAEPLLEQAYTISEGERGTEHPDTVRDSVSLATLYQAQGKYREAEPLLMRALSIREQQSGAQHPDTAQCLSNLATLYNYQGKYAQAEPLLIRALSIREKQLGANHLDTANSLNNLAALYGHQGKHTQAEPLYERALSIQEQQLGAQHPDTALSLNNLAALYYAQGKYREAEPLLMRALSIREQQSGVQHPDTAQCLNNLAALYQVQGKYGEAEPLLIRALSIREQQLGAQHPNTATSLDNLAALYQAQGKYGEAEPLLIRALSIREQQLGTDHPDTAQSLNNLALLSKKQRKYEEAESFYVRAFAIRMQQLGLEHPDTAQSLNNLAVLYHHQGKYREAEPLYIHALAITEQQLGPEHPDTASSLSNLASLYQAQGKYREAEPLYIRALSIYERMLGSEHPDTQNVRQGYALLLRTVGRDEDLGPR